jgi:lipoprotein NlpI
MFDWVPLKNVRACLKFFAPPGQVILALGLFLTGLLAWPVPVAAAEQAADLFQQAKNAAEKHDFATAIRLASQVEEAVSRETAPGAKVPPSLFYLRGRWHFQAGKIKESLADFDRYLQLQPEMTARLWERGIACYYAGQFVEGAKQFERYQTYYDNDVENSVWRFLCQAKAETPEKARESLMPIKNDPRVPLMQLFALFQGKGSIDDVWRAVKAGNPPEAERKEREFYAHLYLAIYHDAHGDGKLTKEHIDQAVKLYEKGNYMGDVARVHQTHLPR